MPLNIEFKARCSDPDRVRRILAQRGADYHGRDHQIDVYFDIEGGRLKLRKGDIEKNLIHYTRSNQKGPKQSDVTLYSAERVEDLEEILKKFLKVKVVVDKRRDIYFIENVKFHIDEVSDLGSFVEVEAIDRDGSIGKLTLQTQCAMYKDLLQVKDADLVSQSYSDLLLQKNKWG